MARKKSQILTEKQEALANALLDGKNKKEATLAAGYSPSTVITLPDKLKEHVQAAREKLSDDLQLRRADIIEGILDAVSMARLIADPGSMIRGYSEVAKMLGMYEPEKKVLEVTDNQRRIQAKYESMSTADLLRLMEARVIDGESTRVN